MKRKTLTIWTLSIALALGLASCQDTCLTDGGNNSGNDTEQNDALAQKYQTLETLLGALADVDSLPDNWNSPSYTVTPTVGVLKDESTPHIRYVATTSQAEADRIYRSYLSKDVTPNPSDDSWQMDGIGSMQFKLENDDPNHFATLKVQVQQLPALEEVRFVSEEALGSNAKAPEYCYYSFGDVVYQNIEGKPTFWVCVRPCSTSPKLLQSQWCTLQLVPEDKGSASNYVTAGSNCYLPTRLATDKSDAERQIQNFFNVLRVLANPDFARTDTYTGIDDIRADNENNDDATYNVMRTTAFMWDYMDLWNPKVKFPRTDDNGQVVETLTGAVANEEFTLASSLKTVFKDLASTDLDAYYYGYSKNFFAKGDYTVYKMNLKTTGSGLFNNVVKTQPYVLKSDRFDFRKAVTGQNDVVPAHTYPTVGAITSTGQFVVKYRSGAELEGKRHSANDVDPTKSFMERRAKNGIEDVLVSKNWRYRPSYDGIEDDEPKNANVRPFFAFGDEVLQTVAEAKKDENNFTYRFCIRNAHPDYKVNGSYDLLRWRLYTSFVGYPKTEGNADEDIADEGIDPSELEVKVALFEMALATMQWDGKTKEAFKVKDPEANDPVAQARRRLCRDVVAKRAACLLEKNMENKNRLTLEIKLKSGDYYLIRVTQNVDGTNREYEVEKNQVQQLDQAVQVLYFYSHYDDYTVNEKYSKNRTLYNTLQDDRLKLKDTNAQEVIDFLEEVR